MTDINLKTLTPDTSLPTTGFLFGADSQASTNPSVYSTQTVATTLLGSTSLTGDTLTASAPVLNLTQQWNSSGTTFTGLKFNVDTTTYNQSATASLLMDLQVGAVSKFKVDKAGNAYVGNPAAGFSNTGIMAMGAVFGTGGGNPAVLAGEQAVFYASSAKVGEYVFGSWFKNNSTFTFQWSSTSVTTGATDLTLSRKGAANLQLGPADAASPLAQTLSVQSVVASTGTNTAGQNFTINGSIGTGTGAGGSIIFQVAPASTGAGAGFQNVLAPALTINSAGLVSVTPASGSSTSFQALRGSISTPAYSYSTDVNSGTFFGAYNGLNCQQISVGGNLQWIVGQSETGTAQIGPVAWAAKSSTSMAAPDLYLYRDAANILALKNSTTAQEFRVYETTTGPIYKALLGNRQLMKISGASFTDGAGASAGTLTNAPAVGNPTKWIPIDDNGTTRYIPAW